MAAADGETLEMEMRDVQRPATSDEEDKDAEEQAGVIMETTPADHGDEESQLPAASTASPAATATAAHSDKNHHFTAHEFGTTGKTDIRLLDTILEDNPLFRRQLFLHSHRPRQFFIDNVLYREKDARKVTWEELFVDLLYVAVISRLGGSLKVPHITWLTVNDFALLFIPIFFTWTAYCLHMNRYFVNDLLNRLFTYTQLLLAAGMGLNAEYAFNDDPDVNTGVVFIITFMLSRGLYALAYIYHARSNPEFAKFIYSTTLPPLLANIPWFVSIFISAQVAPNWLSIRRWLWWSSFVLDVCVLVSVFVVASSRRHLFRYRVAVNIEHMIERYGLFVIIILGEMVVSLLWPSQNTNFSLQYADTILGIIVAICWQWQYFVLLDAHGGRFVHPIRRHTYAGITWNLLHLPFGMFLVIHGVGMGLFTRYDPQALAAFSSLSTSSSDITAATLAKYGTDAARWFVCGGFAAAMLCCIITSLLFKTLDTPGCASVNPRHMSPSALNSIGSGTGSSSSGSASGVASGSDEQKQSTGAEITNANMASDSQLVSSQDDSARSSSGNTFMDRLKRKKLARDAASFSSSTRPACLRYKVDEAIRLGIPLDPRLPKSARLAMRMVLVVCVLLIGVFGESLSATALLGTIAALFSAETFCEEYGRLRVPRSCPIGGANSPTISEKLPNSSSPKAE